MTALEPTDEKIEEYYTEEDYEYEEDFDDLGLKAIVKIGNLCYWMKYSKVNDMKIILARKYGDTLEDVDDIDYGDDDDDAD